MTKVYMLVIIFEVAMVFLQKATQAHAQEDWPDIWRSSGLTATLYLQIGFRLEKTTLFSFYSITADWFHCRLGFSWAYLAWLSVVDYLAAPALDCLPRLFFSQRSNVVGYDLSATIDFPVSFLVHLFHLFYSAASFRWGEITSVSIFFNPIVGTCLLFSVRLSQSRFAII